MVRALSSRMKLSETRHHCAVDIDTTTSESNLLVSLPCTDWTCMVQSLVSRDTTHEATEQGAITLVIV